MNSVCLFNKNSSICNEYKNATKNNEKMSDVFLKGMKKTRSVYLIDCNLTYMISYEKHF
jgi:hypothetical protein